MSVEAEFLAGKINRFILDSETSKEDKIYEEGLNQFNIIKRDITFITSRGLDETVTLLDENGKKVYQKYFEKYFKQEKIKINKNNYASR